MAPNSAKDAIPSQSDTLQVDVLEASTSSSSSFEPIRIFAHPSTLRLLRIPIASPAIVVRSLGGQNEWQDAPAIVADVWPRSTVDPDTIGIPSDLLPTDETDWQARLVALPSTKTVEDATQVEVEVTATGDSDSVQLEDVSLLTSLAKDHLLRRRYIAQGTSFMLAWAEVQYRATVISTGMRKSASQVNGDSTPSNGNNCMQTIVKATRAMTVSIVYKSDQKQAKEPTKTNGALQKESAYATLGGLDAQIEEVRKLVELPLRRPDIFQRYGLRAPRGLLLFGPPGTGKTTLAYSAARACVPASSIETISGPELSSSLHGGTERALRKVFARAQKNAPSVVIIDEIDALAPRRDGEVEGAGEVEKRVVATLLTLMDGLGGQETEAQRVVVIAATNRPNALDPALRRPGRLDREIEVGIPSRLARKDILQVLLRDVPHTLSTEQVQAIADRTHGYVGADLSALVREAGMQALSRDMAAATVAVDADLDQRLQQLSLNGSVQGLQMEDFAFAQAKVRPSAMREIALELPKVTWEDVAPGQAGLDVQRTLRQCVEWPLQHRETMQRLGIDAPRGILLYGPPGCSKTLIARALANESGLNFVAVKGPELLNKYVGESERALREVFRKARAAAPSIVFFDEIDGMTTARGQEGGAGDKLITTLLNEMDGVEQAADVIVVAATNRPDVLDGALLRPGRLDRLLYVGPPDRLARRQILTIRTRGMALDGDVDLERIADLTDGCSGAEVVSVCQEAGLRAMEEDLQCVAVQQAHLEAAAKGMRRRITPQLIRQFEAWRDQLVR